MVKENVNRYGLPRPIPEDVKRAVRQRCGFGCVVCGGAIVDYEHVYPEFKDAKEHDPLKITLLCPSHHSEVTRKFRSKRSIAVADGKPVCRNGVTPFGDLEPSDVHPYIKFGGVTLRNCAIPIEVNGVPLIKVERSEDGGPFLLSAAFYDEQGKLALEIDKNEWRPSAEEWDVTAVGGVVSVWSKKNKSSLRVKFDPGAGIIVEHLDMLVHDFHFTGNVDTLTVEGPGISCTLSNCISDRNRVGMSFASPPRIPQN